MDITVCSPVSDEISAANPNVLIAGAGVVV
jgi:hypothetical protein